MRDILQRQVLAELRDELAQIGDELAIQEAIKNRLDENLRKNLAEAAKYANQRMDIDEVKQQITALEDFGRRLHQAILEHDMAIDASSRVHLVSSGVGDTPVINSPAISSRLWMSIVAALTVWLLVPVAVILLRSPRWIFGIAFPGALNRQGVAPST